jgi:Flp pilus assembly protein TadD
MLLKRVLIATAFSLAGSAALAATAPASSAAKPPAAAPAKPPAAPVKATAEQRAEADRLPPLVKAAFWAREVDIDQTDMEARLKLARALRGIDKFDEAMATVDQLLVVQPNNFEALLESARDRIAANKGFYAIEPAQRAEVLAPRDWRPVSLLAVALEQSDRESEALAAHQKAFALAPNNPAAISNLGMYYATHGDPAQAEPLLRKAAGLPGATAQERQNLALVLWMQGRYAEAEQLERQDLPPDQVANNLAYLHASTDGGAGHTWESLKSAQ